MTYFTPVADFTARRYALMFAVQVEAPFELAQLVLPGMRERGRGWILNISSIAARHPSLPPGRFATGSTVYGMCKAALERFSTGLAAELYEDNIAVNALSPTLVVPTPGTIFHHLTTEDDPNAEPPSGDGRGGADALPRRSEEPDRPGRLLAGTADRARRRNTGIQVVAARIATEGTWWRLIG